MLPLGRRRHPLRLFSALQSRMFYRENVVGGCSQAGALQRQKVPPKSPSSGFSGLKAPIGALQRRKIPPKSPFNDDRRAPSFGPRPYIPWAGSWVKLKWRPPSPCPPFVIFQIPTLLSLVSSLLRSRGREGSRFLQR